MATQEEINRAQDQFISNQISRAQAVAILGETRVRRLDPIRPSIAQSRASEEAQRRAVEIEAEPGPDIGRVPTGPPPTPPSVGGLPTITRRAARVIDIVATEPDTGQEVSIPAPSKVDPGVIITTGESPDGEVSQAGGLVPFLDEPTPDPDIALQEGFSPVQIEEASQFIDESQRREQALRLLSTQGGITAIISAPAQTIEGEDIGVSEVLRLAREAGFREEDIQDLLRQREQVQAGRELTFSQIQERRRAAEEGRTPITVEVAQESVIPAEFRLESGEIDLTGAIQSGISPIVIRQEGFETEDIEAAVNRAAVLDILSQQGLQSDGRFQLTEALAQGFITEQEAREVFTSEAVDQSLSEVDERREQAETGFISPELISPELEEAIREEVEGIESRLGEEQAKFESLEEEFRQLSEPRTVLDIGSGQLVEVEASAAERGGLAVRRLDLTLSIAELERDKEGLENFLSEGGFIPDKRVLTLVSKRQQLLRQLEQAQRELEAVPENGVGPPFTAGGLSGSLVRGRAESRVKALEGDVQSNEQLLIAAVDEAEKDPLVPLESASGIDALKTRLQAFGRAPTDEQATFVGRQVAELALIGFAGGAVLGILGRAFARGGPPAVRALSARLKGNSEAFGRGQAALRDLSSRGVGAVDETALTNSILKVVDERNTAFRLLRQAGISTLEAEPGAAATLPTLGPRIVAQINALSTESKMSLGRELAGASIASSSDVVIALQRQGIDISSIPGTGIQAAESFVTAPVREPQRAPVVTPLPRITPLPTVSPREPQPVRRDEPEFIPAVVDIPETITPRETPSPTSEPVTTPSILPVPEPGIDPVTEPTVEPITKPLSMPAEEFPAPRPPTEAPPRTPRRTSRRRLRVPSDVEPPTIEEDEEVSTQRRIRVRKRVTREGTRYEVVIQRGRVIQVLLSFLPRYPQRVSGTSGLRPLNIRQGAILVEAVTQNGYLLRWGSDSFNWIPPIEENSAEVRFK